MNPAELDSSEPRIKVLILSAGSLLGQNILDAIEPHRRRFRVIGADAGAENARLFRCDTAYVVPPVHDEPSFTRRFAAILEAERPDIVFPGRDHDVLFLADYRERFPSPTPAIPCGCLRAAEIMQDKAQSFAFARAEGLPFVESLLLSPETKRETVSAWVGRRDFPIVAKPCGGYGSIGIRFLLDAGQVFRLPFDGSHLLQEYIGPPLDPGKLSELGRTGVPLFHTMLEESQFAGQAIIAPSGETGEVCCTRSTMVLGRCEASRPMNDPGLSAVVQAYAKAFARIGWRGSFNVQLRRTPAGDYLCHELSGRMSGSTSARRYLGWDEIRLLVRAFLDQDIGAAPGWDPAEEGYVIRSLTDYFVPIRKVAELQARGVWRSA